MEVCSEGKELPTNLANQLNGCGVVLLLREPKLAAFVLTGLDPINYRITSFAFVETPHITVPCRYLILASISHLERRAVLRPRAAVIVDARGGDVGVAEPFLHLGDVGLVVERVGGGRRAQRMRADLEAERAE